VRDRAGFGPGFSDKPEHPAIHGPERAGLHQDNEGTDLERRGRKRPTLRAAAGETGPSSKEMCVRGLCYGFVS
jgi:hypothetical protein